MHRTVRVALVALTLALAPHSSWAGEPPPGDESALQVVARLRDAGDLQGAAARAKEITQGPDATVEAHIAYQDLSRDLGRDAALASEYRARARAEGATADDLWLYARLLRGSKAVAQYRAALRADPAHHRSLCGLGNEMLDVRDLRAAAKSFEQARDVRPASGLPWNGLGRVAEAGGDVKGAEERYRRAIDLSPGLVVARVNLGVLLVGAGRAKEALEVLDAAAKAAPHDPLPLVAQGVARLRTGDPEAAVKAFDAALAIDARSIATLNMLANTYVNLQKLDFAEKAVRRALEIDPDSVATQVTLASLQLAQGDVEGARAAAERAVALDPDAPSAAFVLARALDRAGEGKKAEAAYRRALRADETNAVHVRALAQYLGRQDRWRDAVRLFQRVVELTHASGDALYDLALAQVGANEPKKAAETLETMVAAEPDRVDGWLKLGIVCRERLRDEKRALKAFQAYVDKGGKDARVPAWIADLRK